MRNDHPGLFFWFKWIIKLQRHPLETIDNSKYKIKHGFECLAGFKSPQKSLLSEA